MKIGKIEALRGFAALYVVIHHFIGYTILKSTIPAFVRLPFRFGQEAVIIFFLMSGFVIYLSSSKNPHISFSKYLLRRFVRIYPIAIISFLLSIMVVAINNGLITINDWKALGGNLLMLQDTDNKPGTIVLPFLKNYPLWSLSYEWWFYIMFYPIFIFLIKKRDMKVSSVYLVLLISVIGWVAYNIHPNHIFLIATYFSLWWSGVVCAEVYLRFKDFSFKNLLPAVIPLLAMSCLTLVPVIQTYIAGGKLSQIMYPVVVFRHYCFALSVIFLGLAWWNVKLVGFNALFGWFEKISPISYGIYITHFIFIWLNIPFIGNPYVAIVVKLILVLITAYLLEIKFQYFISGLLRKKKVQAIPVQTKNNLSHEELSLKK
jgi:peptidoglycan/LPS O-acetylase OafA/YrhL